jgi:hypothetical protein
MILEMKNQGIKIKENSCELSDGCKIIFDFKDVVVLGGDFIRFFINDKEVFKNEKDEYILNNSIHTGKETKIVVLLINSKRTLRYETTVDVKNYISFGSLGFDMLPQVFLDQNRKIEELEKRIYALEKNRTVF